MNTEFVLVRHGETASNAGGIIQGHLQTELNAIGIRQAELAAVSLKGEHFDAIISSDLIRALKTAQIIAEAVGISEVIPDAGLREWDLGDFQGKSVDQVNREYPHVLDAFRYAGEDFAIPGGERRTEFYARVHQCLDRLAEEYAGKKILLVSHGGSIKAIFCKIAGTPSGNAMMPMASNASISRFICREGKYWQLNSWNEVSHLKMTSVRETATF